MASSPQGTFFKTLPPGILLGALLIVTSLSGWISLHEGFTRFLWPFTMEDPQGFAESQLVAVRDDPSIHNLRSLSIELWGIGKLTSAERMIDSRLPEHGLYYATMPTFNQAMLLAHVLLAAFCMLFGTLQFIPPFRKRYMRVHRLIGRLYILTVPPAVLTSLIYLFVTPPHHIYDHLIAWIALWVFGVLAIFSVIMAVNAIRQKRIYEHQAWMAISFGCLLVAPLLRWNWIWLAWIFPHIDQETLNLVTMGAMLPQSIFITYFLVLANRQYQRPMVRRQPLAIGINAENIFQKSLPVWYLASVATSGVTIFYLIVQNGMAGFAWFSELVPALLIEREHAALRHSKAPGALLALLLTVTLPACVYLLSSLLRVKSLTEVSGGTRKILNFTAIASISAGIFSVMTGWNIGLLPENAIFSGGTLYTVNGAVIATLGLYLWATAARSQLALAKESLVFLIAMLPFPALFLITAWALQQIGLPADYIASGQGFVVPVGFSVAPLFVAVLYLVYSQATREHS